MVKKSSNKHGFRPPRKVEEYWNLYKKAIYVEKPQRRLPAWFFPLLALVLIIALVFWAAPMAISRLQGSFGRSDDNPEQIKLIYDSDTWVVKKPVADLFQDDDLKSGRITQALYNEPVKVTESKTQWGFKHVILSDGSSGYMLNDDISDYRQSIEPSLALFKVTVISSSKRIMSHARSGTLLTEVMMGTQLFSDYRGDGILRVHMPEGGYGWVSEDGLLIMDPEENVQTPDDGARYFCSSAMAFHHVTVLEQGQSMAGASIPGVTRIAALVNGVILPRGIEYQMQVGNKIDLAYLQPDDEESDSKALQPDLSSLAAGDLVFADDKANPGTPVSMAIVMENGQFLMSPTTKTSIELVDPTIIPDWTERIISVRRIFPEMEASG